MSYTGEAAGGTPPTVVSTSPYTVLATDEILLVTLAAAVINLPAIADHNTGRVTVKDATGLASSQNITVNASAGETIDGLATRKLVNNFQSFQLVGSGTNWSVV